MGSPSWMMQRDLRSLLLRIKLKRGQGKFKSNPSSIILSLENFLKTCTRTKMIKIEIYNISLSFFKKQLRKFPPFLFVNLYTSKSSRNHAFKNCDIYKCISILD